MADGFDDAAQVAGDACPAHATGPKGLLMDADLVQSLRSRRVLVQSLRSRRVLQTTRSADLTACSLCLRVRRGSEWLEAEQVIRQLRTYELDAPPRLHPGVCDLCAESMFGGRAAGVDEPVAA